MEALRELGKMMLVVGLVLLAAGGLILYGGKLPFRLGRLPGDIVWQGKSSTFYFPIVTCIVLSAVLSVFFWLLSAWRK
jgi:hypothetical protein